MPRPPNSRAGLDRPGVVRAAAGLVNAEGIEALTMNRLARELGVKPPSIYNHIQGLAGLRRELALLSTRALGDCIITAAIGKSGPEGVRALAQAYRGYIKEFPGLYQASLRASGNLEIPDPELRAAEERVVQVALAMVASFGLEGEQAIHAVRADARIIPSFSDITSKRDGAGYFSQLHPFLTVFFTLQPRW